MAPKHLPVLFVAIVVLLVTPGCPQASSSKAHGQQKGPKVRPTATPTPTPDPTATPAPTSTPTPDPTATPAPTASATPTPTPTATPTSTYTPVVGYAGTWVGNTYGFGGYAEVQNSYPVGRFIQPTGDDITVESNGNFVVIGVDDEGHRYIGLYGSDGSSTGAAQFNCVLEPPTSYNVPAGGFAATNNGTYVYAAITNNGSNWLQRYDLSLNASTFSGGSGKCSNQITVDASGSSTQPITGMASNSSEVYVADSYQNKVLVYDANAMTLKRSFSVTSPGRIAYDPNTSTLWVVSGGTTINHYDLNGNALSGTITSASDPLGLAIQPGTGYLWVADSGSDQNIKEFNSSGTPVTTFGQTGGAYSSVEGGVGVIAPDKLWFPHGVGFDSSGDFYVLGGIPGGRDSITNGHMDDIRKFDSSGAELWADQGMGFVQAAAIDTSTDGQDLYVDDAHFKMNYANLKTGASGGGTEQTYYSVNVDPFLYPSDPRLLAGTGAVSPNGGAGWGHSGEYLPYPVQILNLSNHKYMMVTGMYQHDLIIYRFNGEIAVPSFMIGNGGFYSGSYPNAPSTIPWVWRDTNGDGNPQAGEFSTSPSNIGGENSVQWWRWDANGNLWWVLNTSNIVELPLQGIDANGNLTYNPSVTNSYPAPAPFNRVQMAYYDSANDVMYVSGYTPALSFANDEPCGTYSAGSVLARYNNWSTGNRTAAWTANLPWNPTGSGCPPPSNDYTSATWTVATDKVFVALFNPPNTAGTWYISNGDQVTHDIYAFDANTGAKLGEIIPTVEQNYWMGWNDINGALTGIKRSNGEYVVGDEGEISGRVLLFRGLLQDYTQY